MTTQLNPPETITVAYPSDTITADEWGALVDKLDDPTDPLQLINVGEGQYVKPIPPDILARVREVMGWES